MSVEERFGCDCDGSITGPRVSVSSGRINVTLDVVFRLVVVVVGRRDGGGWGGTCSSGMIVVLVLLL